MAKGKFQNWITEDGLTVIEGWARDGLSDKQIAHNIGISEQTLNNWKNRFPEFFESLKKGKEVVDYEVENALLKRAKGFEYQEVTIEVKTDENGKEEKHKKVITKFVPPDTGAICFWLKNRRPDKWRDIVKELKQEDSTTAEAWMEAVIGADDE